MDRAGDIRPKLHRPIVHAAEKKSGPSMDLSEGVALISISYGDSFVASSRFPDSKPVFAYFYGWYTKNAWYGGSKKVIFPIRNLGRH